MWLDWSHYWHRRVYMIYTNFLWSTWKLQTSTFRLSRKKLQLISMAFAKFVVLGTNSSKHTITCFCYKYRKSRHSQLLHNGKVSSVFPYFLFKKSWRWRHWWGMPGVWYRLWILLDMIHTPSAFITYRSTCLMGVTTPI